MYFYFHTSKRALRVYNVRDRAPEDVTFDVAARLRLPFRWGRLIIPPQLSAEEVHVALQTIALSIMCLDPPGYGTKGE